MSFITSLFRTKNVESSQGTTQLKRCLSAFDLTLLGIGAIIGAGIFVLTGIAAATKAGPGIIFSYALAGIACGFSALAYAELSSSIGGCGSAYGYAYAGLGEFIAWIIGWDLLLEYGVACSTVAIGWSGYVANVMQAMGIQIPHIFLYGPFEHGIANVPAIFIALIITAAMAIGIKEATRFNNVMVFIKLVVILLFIIIAAFNINPANWHPFLPFGWQGIVSGAALIFFAYIGFDAVSTAAEEAINPSRDLPIGIIASLLICTLVYMIVAGLLTGIAHYSILNVPSPVSVALLDIGHHLAAGIIGIGAIAGLTTVILVMFYGFTRVFLAMSRDKLLPAPFAVINPKTHTPLRIILIGGLMMTFIAGFLPMSRVAEVVNIGTLAAFTVVCAGVVVLRYTKPDMPRPFKAPLSPLVPLLGVILCIYLMLHLPKITWICFTIWTLLGFLVYFGFSRKHAAL